MGDLESPCFKCRYQLLIPAEPAAVRAGCLVVSYSALSYEQQDNALAQDGLRRVAAIAQEWAEECGLTAEGSLVSVQVGSCLSFCCLLFAFLLRCSEQCVPDYPGLLQAHAPRRVESKMG